LLRRMLHAGADPNMGDYDKRTALHIAAADCNLPVVSAKVRDMSLAPAWLWGQQKCVCDWASAVVCGKRHVRGDLVTIAPHVACRC
jgi:hypothetical protein